MQSSGSALVAEDYLISMTRKSLTFVKVGPVFKRLSSALKKPPESWASSAARGSRPKASARASVSAKIIAPAGSCGRSEEHTSELQSLMRISYAVFCLKKKKKKQNT